MRLIPGRCHCGNLRFNLEWPGDGAQIPVRACSCSYCQKHGAVWTSHPHGRLEVLIVDPAAVIQYRFGHRTAAFYICAVCGIVPLATSDLDGGCYAVVNVNTFENVAAEALERSTTDFAGERTDERLARRRRNWMAVTFTQT